jgi:hypothetical protein
LIPSIKESTQFKAFLDIERMCPEHTSNVQASILSFDFNALKQADPITEAEVDIRRKFN